VFTNNVFDAGSNPLGGPENPYVIKDSEPTLSFFKIEPVRTFQMDAPDGRKATVDFGEDAVTYSGDLPVDESAKIFFDAILYHMQFRPCCLTCHWYNNGEELWRECNCPKMVYGYGKTELHSDALAVENDEGWGMVPGPNFGCIHHREKSCLTTSPKT
jgi:hypothetical protein